MAEAMTHRRCNSVMAAAWRHPQFSLFQPVKTVDAGLRWHDGEVQVGESIVSSVGIIPTLIDIDLRPFAGWPALHLIGASGDESRTMRAGIM